MQDLNEPNARALAEGIRADLNNARRKWLEFKKGRGWKALGYTSLSECTLAEWGRSISWFYRKGQAQAVRENIMAHGIEPLPMSDRAFIKLDRVAAEIQTEVYLVAESAMGGVAPTESAIDHAIEAFKQEVLTGTIEDGNGEQVRVADLRAAGVAHAILEAKLRNTERLTSGSKREYIAKNVKPVMGGWGRDGFTYVALRIAESDLCGDITDINVEDLRISLWTESQPELVQ